jgi:DGQHR domain-containing protein
MAERQHDPHRTRAVRDVRNLLTAAGFPRREIQIYDPTEEGPDLILTHHTDDNRTLKILVQCKRADVEGTDFGTTQLKQLIRDYASFVQDFKATMAILILDNYTIPERFNDPPQVENVRKQKKVVYWDSATFAFYKQTVKTLGNPYSSYFILHDLGFQIQLTRGQFAVPAFQLRQRPGGPKLWVFAIEPDKLLRIAHVLQKGTARDPEAYQRFLRPSKLQALGGFLARGEGATGFIPNALLVAFQNAVRFRGGKLYIPAKSCSVSVIDGQHRLYGFCNLPSDIDQTEREKLLRKFKLVVIGMKAKKKVQARLFTEINTTQDKINRSLLLDLFDFLNIEEEPGQLLRIRIAKKLRKTPPFTGKIKILSTDPGSITLATLVDYQRFASFVGQYGTKSLRLMSMYFQTAAQVFDGKWDDPNCIFTTNRGFRILTSLLNLINRYSERNYMKLDAEVMTVCLKALESSASSDSSFFAVEKFKGLALGAGAPDRVALIWGARIADSVEDFLGVDERRRIDTSAYEMLQNLETALRAVIIEVLSQTSRNWWTERISADVRRNAENRLSRNESIWPWYVGRSDHPIMYVDFPDYAKVIISNKNWVLFQLIFRDPTITEAKLKELEPIRSDIAHPRPLTPDRYERLRLYSSDLLACIKTWQRERAAPL